MIQKLISILFAISLIPQWGYCGLQNNHSFETPTKELEYLFSFFYNDTEYTVDTLEIVLNRASKIIEENSLTEAKGKYLLARGHLFFMSQELDSAQLYLHNAINVLIKQNQFGELGNAYYILSLVKFGMNDNLQSKAYLYKAESYIRQQNDTLALGNIYKDLAVICRDEGDYSNAIKYNHLAIEIFSKTNNIEQIAAICNNLGTTHYSIGNLPLSIEYFLKANKYFSDLGDNYGIATSLLNVASINDEMGNFDFALNYYNQVIKICNEKGIDQLYGPLFNNIGVLYYKQGKLNDAERYLVKARQIIRSENDLRGEVTVLHSLADLYQAKGNFGLAEENYLNSYAMANSINLQEYIPILLESMSGFYAKIGDFKSAYKYESLLKKTNEKLFNTQLAEQTSEIENKYRSQLKERENIELQYKNQLSERRIKALRIVIIISSFAFILVVISMVLIFRANKILRFKNKEIQIKRDRIIEQNQILEIQKRQLIELNTAKDRYFNITAQNLWEPVGTVKNILGHLIKMKPTDDLSVFMSFVQTSKDAAVSAFNLLENLLYWARFQQNLIKSEPGIYTIVPVLQSIISVQQPKATTKFIVIRLLASRDFKGYFDKNLIEIALRNILENAIKFSTRGGEITLSVYSENSRLFIKVVDTGVGMTREQLGRLFSASNAFTSQGTHGERGSGLGLLLSKAFVELNNGTIQAESSIAEGTKITISLPELTD